MIWNKRPLLFASVFHLVVMFTSCEPQFNTRYGSRGFSITNLSTLFHGNFSNPITSARQYLGKFGWLEPSDWTAVSPRVNETAEPSLVSEGGQVRQLQENETKMTDEEFVSALRDFQQANKLKVSGILDEDTLRIMSQLRCGVPDQTKKSNKTIAVVQNESNIEKNVSASPPDVPDFSGDEASNTPTNAPTTESTIARILRRKRHDSSTDEYNPYEKKFNYYPTMTGGSSFVNRLEENIELDDVISEGELPEQSRVESMEEILAALRKEKLNGKDGKNVNTGTSAYDADGTDLLGRILTAVDDYQMQKRRNKRSSVYQHFKEKNGWGLAYNEDVITWRLVQEWPSLSNPLMSSNEAWFTVKLAFRMWSEVLPRTFREDNTSPVSDVDVLIGFGTGLHNRCPVRFLDGPFMREYAHAWPLPKAEVHFNDAQPFVPVSWIAANGGASAIGSPSNYPISLLKVAIHEIGHSLGLPHNEQRYSIMNPFYQAQHSKELVELEVADRENIKDIYGTCELAFDVVFDWVRQDRLSNGVLYWKYNTYFFRKTWYWLYENRAQRPRYGDPKLTAEYWRGVMEYPDDPHKKIDGAVHIRSWRSPNGPTFFFKGAHYVEYDSLKDQTKRFDKYGRPYPRRIEDDFKGIPYPINTVFYNFKEDLLYFFKDDKVYQYSWRRGRLVGSSLISQAFPGWGGSTPLPNNIDSAYYSYAHQAIYFFKGAYFWKLADKRERQNNIGVNIPYNSVGPRQRISSKWKYICDVGETELIMNLPTS